MELNDDYNIALKYLRNKYGYDQLPFGFKPIGDDDNQILLLLGQYYYGIAVRKELHDLLLRMKIVE